MSDQNQASDDLRDVFHNQLRGIAQRIWDRGLRHLRTPNGVNQYGAVPLNSVKGRIVYKTAGKPDDPTYVFEGYNSGRLYGHASIEFSNLRTSDTVSVDVKDIDSVPEGDKSLLVQKWTNPSPVVIHETAKTTAKIKENESKKTDVSASVSAEYRYEAEAKAGIKIAEASVKTSLTLKAEASVSKEVANSIGRELDTVNGRSFDVPGWSWFSLALTWDQSRVTQTITFSGDLEASMFFWADKEFQVRFDNFQEVRDCFRGLKGNRYGYLSRYYEDNPMSDTEVDNMLQIPPVVIDVTRKADRANNMQLVTDFGKIKEDQG